MYRSSGPGGGDGDDVLQGSWAGAQRIRSPGLMPCPGTSPPGHHRRPPQRRRGVHRPAGSGWMRSPHRAGGRPRCGPASGARPAGAPRATSSGWAVCRACHGANLQGEPGSQQPPGPGVRWGDTRGMGGERGEVGRGIGGRSRRPPRGVAWRVIAADASEVSIAQPRPVAFPPEQPRRGRPRMRPARRARRRSSPARCGGRSPVSARPRWAWTACPCPCPRPPRSPPGQPAAWQHTSEALRAGPAPRARDRASRRGRGASC